MRQIIIFSFTLLSALSNAQILTKPKEEVRVLTATLIVTVDKLNPKGGQLKYSIFNKAEPFPYTHILATFKGSMKLEPGTQQTVVTFSNLPPGTYAASFYQDTNMNSKLDKNLFGFPREPIGFTMNPPLFWGPPRFHESRLDLVVGTQRVLVNMVD